MNRLAKILCLLGWTLAAAWAAPDRVYLRDGRMMEGQVLGEQRGQYTFFANGPSGSHRQIPKQAVKFVLYGDRARAERQLGLTRAAPLGQDTSMASVTILAAEAFGEALAPVVQGATQSIWIAAYYISGHISGPIKDFYDTIREKARAGLDVVLICEYSSDTRPAMRIATMNFVHDHLLPDGVEVLFIRGGKTMHKKMIIVDGKTVLLGSSNLTVAGTVGSNEMNVRVDSPVFARRAATDFERLRARAIPASELK